MVTRSLLHELERMEGPWAKDDDEIISHGMIVLNFRDQCTTHTHARTHIHIYGSVPEESANPPPIHDPGPTLPSINPRRTVKLDRFRWCSITSRQVVHQLSRAIECWKCIKTMESEGLRGLSCDMILVEDGPVEGPGSGSGQMVAPTEISRDRSRRQRDCQVCTCTRTCTVSKELHLFYRIYYILCTP